MLAAPSEAERILRNIEAAGLTLTYYPEEDRLNVRPTAAVTPELAAGIKEYRAQIVAAVREDERPEKAEKPPETRENGHAAVGMIARWAREFGYVSLRDPESGEWHDLPTKDAPGWALWEARKRKELHKGGDRRAYLLTSPEMERLWRDEQPPDEGIVEDQPLEEG